MIEFLDYQCPFCRAGGPAVDSAVAAGVRVAVVHLPLPIHPPATGAALVALCAQRFDEFRDVHHFLLLNTDWIEVAPDSLGKQFGEVSQNPNVARCIADMETEVGLLLQAHVGLATKLGVSSTPYFISRGRQHRGLPSTESLVKLARGN
ncbi:MAG: thioredoxin domain-containing protein [Gemmatimonadales bacterium]|nr:thioredoxin domain-containing protein [Gemmatimonadales bacterium]